MAHASIVTTLPRDAAALAARYDLGAPLAQFQRCWNRINLIGAGAMLPASVFACISALHNFSSLPYGGVWFLIPDMALTLGVFAFGLSLIHRAYRPCAVLVCSAGLLWSSDSKKEVARWTEVAEVIHAPLHEPGDSGYSVSQRDREPACVICRADGTKLTCKLGRSQTRLLAETVARATLPYLLPIALAAFQRGEPVVFGALRLDQRGISQGNKFLPWSQYRGYLLTEGSLSIWRPGGTLWALFPLGRVSNLLVLTKLLDEMRHSQGAISRP